jgi:hypothetical protein
MQPMSYVSKGRLRGGDTTIADPHLIERANEVLDRLVALDGAVANGRAFCALLQSLTTTMGQ